MSDSSKILCIVEDKGHKDFVSTFLRCHYRWKTGEFNRIVKFSDFPKDGKGAGTKHVHDILKEKLNPGIKRILLVVLDADGRKESTPDAYFQTKRRPKDPVLYFVPRRNIETWLMFGNNSSQGINESDNYKKKTPKPESSEYETSIEKLYGYYKDGCPRNTGIPGHLEWARKEFQKFKELYHSKKQ